MLVDARGMADGERGGVDEADAGAFAELGVQIHRQGQQDARHERHEARVAHQSGKLLPQWSWTCWV